MQAAYFKDLPGAIDPTPGYHSHESGDNLEYYLFDAAQALPVAVVRWKAIYSSRARVLDSGAKDPGAP